MFTICLEALLLSFICLGSGCLLSRGFVPWDIALSLRSRLGCELFFLLLSDTEFTMVGTIC